MEPQADSKLHFERYQFHGLLGVGGSSKVYRATDTKLQREVAVKCIDVSGDAQFLTHQIEREAALTAQLNHPNIVQLYDVVKTDQMLGLVMEYVDGITLAEKLQQAKPELSQALDWLIQISRGLCHAHQSGIVHCDLKLDNIIVTAENTVKIADFGIATSLLPTDLFEEDGLKVVRGSYHSVSPEQAQGKQIDFRSDVFSFGLLAYQLLTRRHPFGSANEKQAIMQRIISQPFEFNAVDRVSMPLKLMELISALLEKKVDDRPADMAKVKAVIQGLSDCDNAEDENSDLTRVLSPAVPVRVWQGVFVKWGGAFLVLIFLTSYAWFSWFQAVPKSLYVAVVNPVLVGEAGFDDAFEKQIVTTLKTSLQEGIINLDRVHLIPDSRIESFDNSFKQFGDAVAADYILRLEANCSRAQCQLNLQRLSGPDWKVESQKNWPTIANSLIDIRHTTLSELYSLFDGQESIIHNDNNDEQAYREYLELYETSGAGINATVKQLKDMESIQRRLDFFPLYRLYLTSALDLYTETDDSVYLDYATVFLDRAPAPIRSKIEFMSLQFDLLLKQNKVNLAQGLIDKLIHLKTDRLILNELKAELAAHNNDYQSAVVLERENALLSPSLSRLYNLAISEFYLGHFELALKSANLALRIAPNDTDSQNLVGAIALTQGDVDKAIASYKTLVATMPDGDNLSNLGLSLMLKRDFKGAIKYQLQALKLNSDSSNALLNLADSYALSGDKKSAQIGYQKVLSTTRDLADAMEYYDRAQAQAHLGLHNDAIRTLQRARKRYSESPDLSYSSAIVHSVAGNYSAAIVEVEDAINQGMGTVWFRMTWFEPLCAYPRFVSLFEKTAPLLICSQS